MKRILIISVFMACLFQVSTYAFEPTINKGNNIDCYKVSIDSFTANKLVSTALDVQNKNSDYLVKNYGPSNIWLDGTSLVVTTGSTEGFLLEKGETISVQGRVIANLFCNTAAGAPTAATNRATVYVFMTSCK